MAESNYSNKNEAMKGSSISESQEEGTVVMTSRSEEIFVGHGDFGEHDRNEINVEGSYDIVFSVIEC